VVSVHTHAVHAPRHVDPPQRVTEIRPARKRSDRVGVLRATAAQTSTMRGGATVEAAGGLSPISPFPAAAPRPLRSDPRERKVGFPPILPRVCPARSEVCVALAHKSRKGFRKLRESVSSPAFRKRKSRRRGGARERWSGNIRTEERQSTVYALRHSGSSRAVRPWFVWPFADALKCRRWCYGATDGINSLSTLAELPQSDRSNGP
jgi:hypothetical protein